MSELINVEQGWLSELGPNSGYVEELYALFLTDPSLVGEEWVRYFASLRSEGVSSVRPVPNGRREGNGSASVYGRGVATSESRVASYDIDNPVVMGTVQAKTGGSEHPRGPGDADIAVADLGGGSGTGGLADALVRGAAEEQLSAVSLAVSLTSRVAELVAAYRRFGHRVARINPLSHGVLLSVPYSGLVDVQSRFTPEELSLTVPWFGFKGLASGLLGNLLQELDDIYAGSIGFEIDHVDNDEEREWLQRVVESRQISLTSDHQRALLRDLLDAESFESELHKKYVGAKRFSVEGGETLMPMMRVLLDAAQESGLWGAVIGMAHRGRLNVLFNLLGKPFAELFCEFEDRTQQTVAGAGDVKYHLGFSGSYQGPTGKLEVLLCSNPSHLEFVNPVVTGVARAVRDLNVPNAPSTLAKKVAVLPVQIHGDAAFMGQGVVLETLNFSRVNGYECGGSVHIIVNNQVGFTATPEESRSSRYCSDVAKTIGAPVFHVNGDDVEGAAWAIRTALAYRNRFGGDVVIDLVCFRKYGHNEGDDPTFTQSLMYSEIRSRPSIPAVYSDKLTAAGIVTAQEVQEIKEQFATRFSAAREEAAQRQVGEVCAIHGQLQAKAVIESPFAEELEHIANSLLTFPDGFVPHPKLKQQLAKRAASLSANEGIDWGFAEMLAFGTLLKAGINVRLSGQDSGRGTFSHRHQALDNYQTVDTVAASAAPAVYYPLNSIGGPGKFEVINSVLSETGILGFEYGYSLVAQQRSLVLWEAQFGDFVNGAQVIVDQFISASESKWGERSGVVLLLPHGHEGQGPEHTSARFERFLQLCAEGNMTVVYPSNAAQYFHLLRRQAMTPVKRPLVVLTPKSLLRLPEATASRDQLLSGVFKNTIESDFGKVKNSPKHLIFCSGKVFYDISHALQKHEVDSVRVVRIEQLYPFPLPEIRRALGSQTQARTVTWVQEEPKNQGAWCWIEPLLRSALSTPPRYIGRPEAASTACGSPRYHAAEQKALLDELIRVVTNTGIES